MKEQFTSQKDVNGFVEMVKSHIAKNGFKFSPYFHFNRRARMIPMNLVNKNWKRFSLVRIVEKKSIKGKLGLRFYYELSANETLDLGFIFLENKLLINHITLRPRGWRGMVKEKA